MNHHLLSLLIMSVVLLRRTQHQCFYRDTFSRRVFNQTEEPPLPYVGTPTRVARGCWHLPKFRPQTLVGGSIQFPVVGSGTTLHSDALIIIMIMMMMIMMMMMMMMTTINILMLLLFSKPICMYSVRRQHRAQNGACELSET